MLGPVGAAVDQVVAGAAMQDVVAGAVVVDNLLRQVVYGGLREDKPAAEVRRSVPDQTPLTKVRGVVRPTFSPKPRRLIFLSGENTVRTVSDVLCETPIKRCDLTLVGGSKCLQYGTPFLRLGEIDK
jgi:hypothetical protein